ncbi:MAG: hypothetical protein AAB637_00195 [Patescibacteria group bacterium]
MKKIKRYQKFIFLALLLAFCAFGVYFYHFEYRKPLLEIHIFSLNRGRSVFIRTPQNKTILIGGGQNTEVIRELTKVTPFYKRKIDYIIISSVLPAQIGGLIEVINRYEVEEIIMPKLMATSTILTQLQKEIRKQKIHAEEVLKGDIIEIEKDLKLNILFPYKDFKFNKTSLPELGLSLEYGRTTAYFIGNLSKTIQKYITKNLEIKNGENIIEFYNSAIDSKVSAELIEKIKPKFIWSTKEKTIHFISEGDRWVKIK